MYFLYAVGKTMIFSPDSTSELPLTLYKHSFADFVSEQYVLMDLGGAEVSEFLKTTQVF